MTHTTSGPPVVSFHRSKRRGCYQKKYLSIVEPKVSCRHKRHKYIKSNLFYKPKDYTRGRSTQRVDKHIARSNRHKDPQRSGKLISINKPVIPGGGSFPYKGLMGTCGQPGYVFRDFCLKQGIDFINFCLKQGIFS